MACAMREQKHGANVQNSYGMKTNLKVFETKCKFFLCQADRTNLANIWSAVYCKSFSLSSSTSTSSSSTSVGVVGVVNISHDIKIHWLYSTRVTNPHSSSLSALRERVNLSTYISVLCNLGSTGRNNSCKTCCFSPIIINVCADCFCCL